MTVATRMLQLRRIWKLSLLLVLLVAAACAPAATATPTASQPPASPATPTASPAPSATPLPTHTPTAVPSPTGTASPTDTTTVEPSATATVTPTPSATATNTLAPVANTQLSGDFAPTSPGRWNTSTPVDNMSGCGGTILAPYGPVIIRPNASGLGWVNTANEDYTLVRLGPNIYQYAGATTRGDGTVTIGVTFTSATTFNMSRVFVPTAEPGCTHTYAQTGTFEFAVP